MLSDIFGTTRLILEKFKKQLERNMIRGQFLFHHPQEIREFRKLMVQPSPIIWFTGLSGSGKSTLARLLASELSRRHIDHELLDGDDVRTTLCHDLGFCSKDRNENIRRLGFVASLLARHGVVSIVAAISPYREARELVRRTNPKMIEVYLDCSLDTVIRRDTKGLYRAAVEGRLKNFTGISDPYERPTRPEVHLKTDRDSEGECLSMLLEKLKELGCLTEKDSPREMQWPSQRAVEEAGASAA